MATNWTDEQKDEMEQLYLAAEPTADNSIEIVKDIAEKMNGTANGIRMILSKRGVYVKKTPGKPSATTAAASGDKPARVSKEGAQQALTDAITAAGATADAEIISKLTGKAAQYFAGIITSIDSNED